MKQHELLLVPVENHTQQFTKCRKLAHDKLILKGTGMTNYGVMLSRAAEHLRQGKLKRTAHQVL